MDRNQVLGFKPQQERIYHKLLPYADNLDRDSNIQLAEIKSNLGRAVLLKDIRPGCTHWIQRLSEYIDLFGRKFCKEDHIVFVKLLYELLTIPELEFTIVYQVSQVLVLLLKKRNLLSPDDLELPWRPLYELFEKVAYSPYEAHGLVLFPGHDPANCKAISSLLQELGMMEKWTANMAKWEGKRSLLTSLKSVVRMCRPYFPLSATQEMLEEWRPLLCPFDVTNVKGTGYLELFLPTLLPPEHHDKGFKLWFTEFMNFWNTAHNTPAWESNVIWLYARLALDNIGFIDWEPYIPVIFTKLLRSFNLPVGQSQLLLGRANTFDISAGIQFITALLGGGSSCQKYLSHLLRAIESYFHPSNNGRWNARLQKLLHKLPLSVVKRVCREHAKKPTWKTPTPESHKLSEEDITLFVESMKPCVLLAMFSKTGSMQSASAMQYLSSLRPEIIIPPLIERLYPALETLTEPHRLTAALHCVVAVSRSLVGNIDRYPEGPSHILPLFMYSLPGIDPNDFRKSMVTFQFIFAFVTLVPLVDCSAAVTNRTDLTEAERELCLATRDFEDFVLQFMDRCFNLIESSSLEMTTKLDRETEKINSEEGMIEVVLTSTFTAMLMQCSSTIYQAALSKLKSFIIGRVLETKVSGKLAANMCRAAAKVNPELALKAFLPHFCQVILNLTEAEEVLKEEILDSELLFNLLLLSELIRCDGQCLLQYKKELSEVLLRTLHLTSKPGYLLSGSILRHTLKALTLVAPLEFRSVAGDFNRPLSEYLPIRDWGKSGNLDDLGLQWHVMSADEKEWLQELLETHLVPELNKLDKVAKQENTLTREELQQSLSIILDVVLGAGAALPLWNETPQTLIESQVALCHTPHSYFVDSDGVHLASGANVRQAVGNVLHKVLAFLLKTSEDDTKSLFQIIQIYQNLIFYLGVNKEDFDTRWKSFHFAKRSMENRLLGKKQHIRSLLIDRTQMQHEMFVIGRILGGKFTPFHEVLMLDLLCLATSHYSEVRAKAQTVLKRVFSSCIYSYIPLTPHIKPFLEDKAEVSHEQFKGALYVLLGLKSRTFLTCHNWEIISDLWPAVVLAQHSEKPSIIKLMDAVSEQIQKHLETITIQFQMPEQCMLVAKTLWNQTTPSCHLPLPSNEELDAGSASLTLRNEKNLRLYNQLMEQLVGLAQSGNLRWRHYHLSLVMLSMLLRYDVPPPSSTVELFVHNLIHDTLSVRKVSIASVAAILKQVKRKHKKVAIDPYSVKEDGTPGGDGGLPPTCILPGDRPDNAWLQYTPNFRPKTKEDWVKRVFIEKTHYGFYTWPREMLVYADYEDQPSLERSRRDLSQAEGVLYDFFSQETNINQWVQFLSLEDRKGKDKFDAKRFILFKGLFRNFGAAFLPLFRPHLERLVADSHESSQRCAAEVIAGLIRGSKHWPFELVEEMKSILEPVLRVALSKVTVETVGDWGTCIATASENGDPNRLYWMLELLMEDPMRGGEGAFIESSRLYVLQGGLAQQEWRVAELLHRLLTYLKPYLTHPFQNVRVRLGSLLTNIFLMDIDFPGANRTKCPQREQFVSELRPQLCVLETEGSSPRNKGSLTNSVRCENQPPDSIADPPCEGEKPVTENNLNSCHDTTMKKTAISLLKTVCKWITGNITRAMYPAPAEFFQFLPMICQMESNDNDDELKQDCSVTLACLGQSFLKPDNIQVAVHTVVQISASSSWRARASCLSYLQVMVFSNLFTVLHNLEWVNKIRQVVLSLLEDERVEVREMASVTLGGLLQCNFIEFTEDLMDTFNKKCSQKLRRSRKDPISSEAVVVRHAGILGLSAYVNAYPYDVPEKTPGILLVLGDHLNDPHPIPLTIKKTLSNFKRTHHDNWRDHKLKFSDDQLAMLTDLLVSPSYYA